MKIRKSLVITIVVILSIIMSIGLFGVTASAEEITASGTCGDNLTWVLDSEGVLTISGSGEMQSFSSTNSPWKKYASSIKSVVIKEGVTSIGAFAFYGHSSLASITLPNGITSIAELSFAFCKSLRRITIPATVTEIKANAFSSCNNLVEVYNLSNISISKGTANGGYVGYNALCIHTDADSKSHLHTDANGYVFYEDDANCYLLGYTCTDSILTLPEYCNGKSYQIYKNAFEYNTNLTSVILGKGVSTIGNWAFLGCSNLKSITIQNNITTIGEVAFNNCVNLENVYYTGSESDKQNISILDNNDCLINAAWHLNSCLGKAEHSYTPVVTPPTCTSKGYTTYTCVCGHKYIGNYMDKVSHAFGEWYTEIYATCTSEGTERRDCSDCYYYETRIIRETSHDYSVTKTTTPNCTEPGRDIYTCFDCGHSYSTVYTPALGHNMRSWTYVSHATCTEDGNRWRECTRACGYREEETLPANGHNYYDICDSTCDVCGEERTAPHNYVWVIDRESNCGIRGIKHQECTVCHTIINENTGIATKGNHVFDSTDDMVCSVCELDFVWLHFDSNGGSYVSSIKVRLEDFNELPSSTSKSGYNFAGWSTEKNGHTEYPVGYSYYATEANVTLYAQWNKHCATCSGTGKALCYQCGGDKLVEQHEYYTCYTCKGNGVIPNTLCYNCSGRGCLICRYSGQSYCSACSGKGGWYEVIMVSCGQCDNNGKEACRDCNGTGNITRTSVAAPEKPEVESIYENTITLKEIENGEYSLDGVNWQDSSIFEGLEFDKEYSFYQRYAKTDTTYTSAASEVLKVTICGHSETEWIVDINPSCSKEGSKHQECTICKDILSTEIIEKLPHSYSSIVTAPTCTNQGYTTHTCHCGATYVDNNTEATGHTYENGVCIGCGQLNDYDGHLQQLPESLCGGMNLWPMLRHDSDYYYAGTHWGKLNDVHSVTIPIKPGDKLVATSFAKGIRVAYFDNSGLLISVPSEQVKSEFSANGFLLVPDGAVAVNIPMWDNSATNELYISSRSHSFEEDRCSICQYQRMQVTAKNMAQTVGAVYASDGTYNASYTNNWFADIPIPNGAEQIRVLTFKTGAGCGSAFFGAGKYISGYADTEIGGRWITLDIPVGADTFRYCYLTDNVAQQNDVPLFEYVEFLGKKMGPLEKPPFAYRPSTGCHSFSVEVNIAPAQGNPDGYITGTDYGYIQLPTNYNPYGEPTRLIIVCHGAGASLTTYQSDEWKDTNYSFWTDLGYAVMDMYACPTELTGSNSALHYGNPIVLDCYKAGYDYVMKNFNLKQDGIYVIGSSMGGLSSFQIVQSGQFPVLTQVAYCPVIDLFKQAYCNPWTTASYQRSRISSYFGFTGTLPVFTNGKFPSSEEIAFYKQNLDKTIAYSPILHNLVAGDVSTIFDVIPTSATATNDAEAAIYRQFTATHPCPLIIFHNTDDSTVSYRYSQYFVDMLKQSGQNATLYTFTSGGHNAWANGQNFALEGINGDITIKESQYEAYLFFSKLENHKEHYPWIDPAVAPTCTETGLTEGSHCAFCGEVLKAQETVAAFTHTYTSVATPPTCTEQGYTTHTCHCGDTYIDTYVASLGHNPGAAVVENRVEPTCTTSGSYDSVIYCVSCDIELSRTNIKAEALGHKFENYVSNNDATCTANGTKTAKCERCDETDTKTDENSNLGHTPGEALVENRVDPTCTTSGSYDNVVYCTNCGIELSRCEVIVDALGHTYESWHQIIAPSCEDHGVEYRGCNNCDYYETRTISATGHDWIGEDGYKICEFCGETVEIEKPDLDLEKDHSECESSLFETIINAIINFFRILFGLPKVCICGEELY